MSIKRMVESDQRKMRLLAMKVDGTGTASIAIHSSAATLTDNGTGDYTLTFTDQFAREPIAVASPLTADAIIQIGTISKTAVQILAFDATDGTSAKDVDFEVIVIGSDAEDEM